MGLAILIIFASMGFLATFTGLVIGHLVITLPYALRVLSVSLGNLNLACEEAASSLGAKPWLIFRQGHPANDGARHRCGDGALFPRFL